MQDFCYVSLEEVCGPYKTHGEPFVQIFFVIKGEAEELHGVFTEHMGEEGRCDVTDSSKFVISEIMYQILTFRELICCVCSPDAFI